MPSGRQRAPVWPRHEPDETDRPVLKVLAWVPYPTGRVPGQRYRIEQWEPWLRREGLVVRFAPFLSPGGLDVLHRPGRQLVKVREVLRGYVRRLRQRAQLQTHDVIYLYREAALLAPAWLERRLLAGRPVVYDFDDAIYLPAASAANAWARCLRGRTKTVTLCRLARHVTVGNDVLARFAHPWASALSVVPSTIDTEQYRQSPRRPGPRPVVGWTGSVTTLPYLEALAPALRQLRSEVDFELRVIGGEPRLPGVDVRSVPWAAETETQDLQPLDVGLMPLPEDDWARGKCGMKALQYMALGIPPVVSPVGVNATLVQDGVNGLHARGEQEWVAALRRLLADADLRRRLGSAARRTVEASYSAAVQAPRMARILKEAAA